MIVWLRLLPPESVASSLSDTYLRAVLAGWSSSPVKRPPPWSSSVTRDQVAPSLYETHSCYAVSRTSDAK